MPIVEMIEIMQERDVNWVTFKDRISAVYDLTGEIYRNPTMSSWGRLLHLMSDKTKIEVEFIQDGPGMIIRGWRK